MMYLFLEGARALTLQQHLSWFTLWSLRKDRFYEPEYRRLVKRLKRLRKYASQQSMGYSVHPSAKQLFSS
jgi:hypothetical protein